MNRWLVLVALPYIVIGSTEPIPSDIHIDADIQHWTENRPSFNPNAYELQILRILESKEMDEALNEAHERRNDPELQRLKADNQKLQYLMTPPHCVDSRCDAQ